MLVVADDADTMVSIVSSVDAGDSDGIIEDAVDVDGIPSTTEVIEEEKGIIYRILWITRHRIFRIVNSCMFMF